MTDSWKKPIAHLLYEVTGLEPKNHATVQDPDGREPIQNEAVSVELPLSTTPDPVAVVRKVQARISDPQYLVFLGYSQNEFTDDHSVELVVGRGKSQEDVLRLMNTCAYNYNLE